MAPKTNPPKPSYEPAPEPRPAPARRTHWVWPFGVALAGVGSAAAYLLRGCWHTHMSWPTAIDDEYSYQVCTACGIKRLYDVAAFHAYGPYGYDVNELVARERAARLRRRLRYEEMLARRQAAAQPPKENG